MIDVILVGEAMGVFAANESGPLLESKNYSRGVAGAEVNVGIGLSRLDFDVSLLTKLGKDPFGKHIHNYLIKEKIDTRYVTFDDNHTTGLMLKNKVATGDPQTYYYRDGSAFSTLSVETIKNKIDFKNIRLLHVTGIPPALNKTTRSVIHYLMDAAKEAGTFITFDPNLRHELWEDKEIMIQTMNELAKYANIILPGIEEGKVLTGLNTTEEIADFYLNMGVDSVVIKTGKDGAFIKEKNKSSEHISGFKVDNIVDTVGAGDGFAVGIISGYLDNLSLSDSAKRANAIGSIQVQNQSDNEGLPNRNELNKYIDNFNY
uniref:sugar kinase n=1 Tax=Carnobacterium sp. TaxID=48221 RepID=UPI0034508760